MTWEMLAEFSSGDAGEYNHVDIIRCMLIRADVVTGNDIHREKYDAAKTQRVLRNLIRSPAWLAYNVTISVLRIVSVMSRYSGFIDPPCKWSV